MSDRVNLVAQRRWLKFKKNKRAYLSFVIFGALFFVSLFADVIANDRPILVRYEGSFYFPFLKSYPETIFGGDYDAITEYKDPYIKEMIESKGWIIWPLIPYSYRTHISDLSQPAPTPPSTQNWLGTDDQARDVVARIIYGFRISILFALCLTFGTSVIGIMVGAIQGYFGGKLDLLGQRFLEIWSSLPVLFLLIILASIITPNFWWLLGIMLLFEWTTLVDVVRAEFLRGRNLDYVRAARALGVSDSLIIFRHVLPNAMVASFTFIPFLLTGAIATLTSLDFLGFGLPSGSPSLGELVAQGKNNLQAPWLALSAFGILSLMLTLLVFIGEGVRDVFDPRITHH
jgi:microcin C transport system permease protein